MKNLKKSSSKIWLFVCIGVILILIAIFRHPSIVPSFPFLSENEIQNLVFILKNNESNHAQELWKFREFYSRGTIFLQKFQPLETPKEITDLYEMPMSFIPHTMFVSDKITSIEGTINSIEDPFIQSESLLQTPNIQIVKNIHDNNALIIAQFDVEVASKANGYLYFDLRDDTFLSQNKNVKWLVITYVKL